MFLQVVGFAVMDYLVMSAVTYAVYAYDKAAATARRWRVSENTLHVLSLMGGWPGARIAQVKLRHKLRKSSFMVVYWVTAVLNLVALAVSIFLAGLAGV